MQSQFSFETIYSNITSIYSNITSIYSNITSIVFKLKVFKIHSNLRSSNELI